MDSSGLMVKSKSVPWMWHTYTDLLSLFVKVNNKILIKCIEKILEVRSPVYMGKTLFPCQSQFSCTIIINDKILCCLWWSLHSTKEHTLKMNLFPESQTKTKKLADTFWTFSVIWQNIQGSLRMCQSPHLLNKCHILARGGTLIPWTMVAYLWTQQSSSSISVTHWSKDEDEDWGLLACCTE